MKTMINKHGIKLNIVEHIILRNFWEYYITDQIPVEGNNDIKTALVMGEEIELGDISLSEIKPYIISRNKTLDIMPAQGWEWEKKQCIP